MLYLFGASGHAKVILEIAERNGLVIGGLVDANPEISKLLDYSVQQGLESLQSLDSFSKSTFIVSIGHNPTRFRVAQELQEAGFYFANALIDPSAHVSKRALIGVGSVIMAGATIQTDTKIGQHVIINTNASVDHDCVLGDFVHISPNAALAGNVQVGEGTHIGIGACIIQGVKIGKNCTIGAGSVIIQDIPDGVTVVGNPGRILEKTSK